MSKGTGNGRSLVFWTEAVESAELRARISSGNFMVSGLANRIFVWSYSDTVAYTFETCDSYSAESFGRLHFDASQFIKGELDLFYAEFSEYFNLAEFPDVEYQLQPSEVALFLKAAEAPDDTDFSSIENYDCFSGLRAVIRHRLDQRSLEQLKAAAELFHWTMDCGLSFGDTNSRAVIRVGCAEEVAPFLLERILDQLPDEIQRQKDRAYGFPPSDIEQRFLPLAPLLTILKETVEIPGWAQNQLALRIFCWVADIYRSELENQFG